MIAKNQILESQGLNPEDFTMHEMRDLTLCVHKMNGGVCVLFDSSGMDDETRNRRFLVVQMTMKAIMEQGGVQHNDEGLHFLARQIRQSLREDKASKWK